MFSTCPECGHAATFSPQSTTQDPSKPSRLSAYEDEIRQLRAECARLQREKEQWTADTISPPRPISKDSKMISPPHASVLAPAQRPQSVSRLSSLASMIPGRRRVESREGNQSDPALPPLPPPLPPALAMITSVGSASTPNLISPISSERFDSASPPPFAIDPGTKTQALALANLQASLEAEREMRHKAEANLSQAQTELEESTLR